MKMIIFDYQMKKKTTKQNQGNLASSMKFTLVCP